RHHGDPAGARPGRRDRWRTGRYLRKPMTPLFDPALPTGATGADSGAAPVAPAADPRYAGAATKAAIEFEGFFIAHMLHQMRAGTRELAGEDSVFKDPVNSDMLDLADSLVAHQM